MLILNSFLFFLYCFIGCRKKQCTFRVWLQKEKVLCIYIYKKKKTAYHQGVSLFVTDRFTHILKLPKSGSFLAGPTHQREVDCIIVMAHVKDIFCTGDNFRNTVCLWYRGLLICFTFTHSNRKYKK